MPLFARMSSANLSHHLLDADRDQEVHMCEILVKNIKAIKSGLKESGL